MALCALGGFLSNVAMDSSHILRAVQLADKSAGFTAPHPNSGCVIAHGSRVVGEGYLYGQGTRCAEIQAVEMAGELARGATAYLNLEPGDCHGDDTAIRALQQSGVSKVVIGLRNPFKHHAGKAISALRSVGTVVDILEDQTDERVQEAFKACQVVNAPIIYRALYNVPFSTLKYAMTADGKIACSTGHASWISSKLSRERVFATRARSDAIIVGGNTVRRDNPKLTTRQQGSHLPVRMVMSRTLNLPEQLHLWDVSSAPTIVMTQKGAKKDFQKKLAAKGVEIVEFPFLTPKDVMEYCCGRGFLSVLWECGGTLAAPAVAAGVVHRVFAFIAPKIIGGVGAPSPVGELGMVEMTQAFELADVTFEQIGPDMLMAGYLKPIPRLQPVAAAYVDDPSIEDAAINTCSLGPAIVSFFKSWDPYGALNNFSPHPITLPDAHGDSFTWPSVEHYYQAQKFSGGGDPVALDAVEAIKKAGSPEEAARIGRRLARERPDLIRADWKDKKLSVMEAALRCKFSQYPELKRLLLSTVGSVLMEASPNDSFWGTGQDGTGLNRLGRLLMKIRSEMLVQQQQVHREQKPAAAVVEA